MDDASSETEILRAKVGDGRGLTTAEQPPGPNPWGFSLQEITISQKPWATIQRQLTLQKSSQKVTLVGGSPTPSPQPLPAAAQTKHTQ